MYSLIKSLSLIAKCPNCDCSQFVILQCFLDSQSHVFNSHSSFPLLLASRCDFCVSCDEIRNAFAFNNTKISFFNFSIFDCKLVNHFQFELWSRSDSQEICFNTKEIL